MITSASVARLNPQSGALAAERLHSAARARARVGKRARPRAGRSRPADRARVRSAGGTSRPMRVTSRRRAPVAEISWWPE
jgi:hypothetical protein